MVVWRSINGNGAYYFWTKKEAEDYSRRTSDGKSEEPKEIVITNSEQLAAELNCALGYE